MTHENLNKKVKNLRESFEFLNQIFDEMMKARLKSVEGLVKDHKDYENDMWQHILIDFVDCKKITESVVPLYLLKEFKWDIDKLFQKAADPSKDFLGLEDPEVCSESYFDIDIKDIKKIVENSLYNLDKG